ncbi:PREDICTED: transcriptional adapter ADA2b isoform X2 [Tarenaya hassleriana]|uniref:transcriptional adapter ADA2b isoform X2 n=1 Tax=Tarenaya hassleriana TaxID=28532 RepID=UPI00053C6BA7|nr:PREDICTED: transcriptional adapter ADA2b isoform X2 [Tarenaya hassleriana]
MGRSRGNFHNYEDPTQRTRKKKNAANVENFESTSTVQGTEGGGKYNCDYCQKDITGRIRIKCAVCPDFDLCVECMSVGAEVTPHKSDHPYRVMGNLTFPLICPDWSADDEMLLLEGLEIYGLGNWAEVAEHVGTKSKELCLEHYRNIYLNSPFFPLPDMSHVAGKNRKELQAMAKGRIEDKKVEPNMKEEYPFSPSKIKVEETPKESQADRSFGGKKPIASGNNSLVELSNYNQKRQEFDPEYDNDAEQLLAEMEFKETDTPEEHELKLRVLRIYSKRLDERKRRKEFILERNLLYQNPFEKDLSPEEKALCRRFDVFMRFHSKEEHDEMLRTIVNEYRMLKRLKDLKDAQAAGCRSTAEAERYLERKRKREIEERAKESGQFGGNLNDTGSRPCVQASSSYVNDFDLIGFSESQLLSESEKRLCCETKLVPPVYLHMLQIMSQEIFKGNVTKKSDAYSLFKIDSSKVDRVYDMLVKKGIAQP